MTKRRRVLEARLAGEIEERSIAGQVEFWARIGRSVEQLLEGRQVLALCRNAPHNRFQPCWNRWIHQWGANA